MRIDRYNGNTLRRYHLPSGSVLVVQQNRAACVLPAACIHIDIPVPRDVAARALLAGRSWEKLVKTNERL